MSQFFKHIQKYIALITIIAVLVPSFLVLTLPQKAGAAVVPTAEVPGPSLFAQIKTSVESTVSAINEVAQTTLGIKDFTKEWIINPLVDAAAAALIWQMFDSINAWIKNGFDGKPLFVTDWEGYLDKAGNEAFGIYVDKLIAKGAPDICSPFRTDVIIGLVSVSRPQPRCTLDAFVANVNELYGRFETYGWTGYAGITTSNVANNAFGSFLLQMDQTQRVIAQKVFGLQQEAQASRGFLSWKKCSRYVEDTNNVVSVDADENPIYGKKCAPGAEKTVTPGSYVENKLNLPDNYTATRLAVAKGIDGLISALAQQLIQMGLQALKPDGLAGSRNLGAPSYAPSSGDPSDPLTPQRRRINDTLNQNVVFQENRYISVKQQSVNSLEEKIEILQKITSCGNQNRQTETRNAIGQIAGLRADIRDSQRRIGNINTIIADANGAKTPQELTNITLRMTSVLESAIGERMILGAEDERDNIRTERDALKTEFQQIEDNLRAQGKQCQQVPDNFLTVTRASISEGGSSAISWVPPEGTQRCVASEGWIGEKNPEGGIETVTPIVTTTYALRCASADLSSFTSSSVIITVFSSAD